MKQNSSNLLRTGSVLSKVGPGSSFFTILILSTAGLTGIFSSAKWHIALFAWLSPFLYLYFFRLGKIRKKLLWLMPVLVISSVISSKDVAPFPFVVLIVLAIIESLKKTIIFLLDRWIVNKTDHFASSLFFPAAFVTLEFLNAKMGGGVWWSVANSQYSISWLTQLASVTGLWGISFLIYWFASVGVWALNRHSKKEQFRSGLIIYGCVLTITLLFGAIRYNSDYVRDTRRVKVAGLSVPLMSFLQNLYKDYCGKDIVIDQKTSITSAKLQEVTRAELPFIESADTVKFRNGFNALHKGNDSLFSLSRKAAEKGAKIIIWSEANAIVFKFDERKFIERGKKFALENKIYLLMAIAVIHNGEINPGKKFLENEAVFVGPEGQILNVFHKNNPVPMAEASEPGDGIIPVVETPYGRISTSICYDADFPLQMRQLGKNQTDLLLLPSGDWYAIASYHANMSVFRAIENGSSVLRQASGGLSIVTDYRGKISASFDFFKPGEKLWTADIEIGHVPTVYCRIGDAFAYICIGIVSIGLIYLITVLITAKFPGRQSEAFTQIG